MSIDNTAFALSYQHWFGPATFLRCPFEATPEQTDIGLIGVPFGGGNPIEHMQYLGPRSVRNRSMGYARSHREFGINPFELARVRDLGDVPLPRSLNPDMAAEDIESYFKKVFQAGVTPVSVGGDHSITWPIIRAARQTRFEAPLAMIHFDSHTDAIEPLGGTRNHAGGFRMGAEDGLIDPGRTIQIGMRGHLGQAGQDDWAKENFASVVTTQDFLQRGGDSVLQEIRRVVGDGPVYLSFDLDVLDPSDAPGVADPELDGLRLREVRQVLLGLRGLQLIGGDVVCYRPPLDDAAQRTALVASLVLYEMVTMIADRMATSVR